MAQDTRLRAFRLLLEVGADGLPAGEVARRIGTPSNTMSTHLAILTRSGLVRSRRDGKMVIYAAEIVGLRDLITFLVQDCCGGRPEACTPLLDVALPLATRATPGCRA